MVQKFVYVLLAALLGGCGTAYVSSSVPDNDDQVTIVELNTQTVQSANRSTYTPRTLPAVFFQSAGTTGPARGVGVIPSGSLPEQARPGQPSRRLPPEPQVGPYRIGVGDVVLLATRGARDTVEELSGLLAAQNSRQGYTVQDDGAIAIPEIGRVALAGLTLEEAEAALFQHLVENQIDPAFSLEIAEFNAQRVSIGGSVTSPGVIAITLTPLTLDQALSAVGGVTARDRDFALIRLYRDGVLYQIPLSDYLSDPKLQKTRLIAGDSLFVDTEYELDKAETYFREQIALSNLRLGARERALEELLGEIRVRRADLNEIRTNFEARVALDGVERDYVYLAGERTRPGRYTLPFGRRASLADALFSEDGFSNVTANPSQIYVLRGAPEQDKPDRVLALHLNARNAANYVLATRLELRPNDVVFISEQPITRWNRVVQQLSPVLVTSSVALATN
ncbi:MAG: polysaccharide biosynthesis/export family protein [Pseudomonadota bacterium]